MQILVQSIPLTSISDSGSYSLHPYLKSDYLTDNLLESLYFSGILHPPILLKNDDGTYDIVSGRKRLYFVAEHRKENSCLCRILSADDNVETILSFLLEDQFLNGKLSFFEQAYFCTLAKKLLGHEQRVQDFFSSLPPGRITRGRQYFPHADQYSDEVKRCTDRGLLSEKALSALNKFEKMDQDVIMQLFGTILPGQNKQKRILQEIFETLQRDELSLIDFLNTPQIAEIINHPEMNPPQKCEQLLTYCYQKNYPMLNAATISFTKAVDNLNLPPNCRITHSQAFERDEVSLQITFSNIEELQEKWRKICQVI